MIHAHVRLWRGAHPHRLATLRFRERRATLPSMKLPISGLFLILASVVHASPVVTEDLMRAYLALEASLSDIDDSAIKDDNFTDAAIDRTTFLYIRKLHRRLDSDSPQQETKETFRGLTRAQVLERLPFLSATRKQIGADARVQVGHLFTGADMSGMAGKHSLREPYIRLFQAMTTRLFQRGPQPGETFSPPPELTPLHRQANRIFDKTEREGYRSLTPDEREELRDIMEKAAVLGVDLFVRDARAWIRETDPGIDQTGLWRMRLDEADRRNLRVVEKALAGGLSPPGGTTRADDRWSHLPSGPRDSRSLRKATSILHALPGLLAGGASDQVLSREVDRAVDLCEEEDNFVNGRHLNPDNKTTTCLRKLLSRGEELRAATVKLIGFCGPRGAPMVPDLIPLLSEEDFEGFLRYEVANALRRIGPAATEASAPLLKFVDSDHQHLAMMAVAAVSRIGGAGIRELRQRLMRGDSDLMANTIIALALLVEESLPFSGDQVSLLEIAMKDDNAENRLQATEILSSKRGQR